MRKLNEKGSLVLPLIIVLVLLLGSLGFGVWAFMGRQDYKNNSDDKAAVAAKKAVIVEAAKKDLAFAEKEKSPVKTFKGPETYGTLTFDFPKTWNEYIPTASAAVPVDIYFNPDFIPDISSPTSQFALRVQVSGQTYPAILKTYDAAVKAGTASVSAYIPAKLPSVRGSIVTGVLSNKKVKGVLIYLPLRDKTIVIWTEGLNNTADFMNTVLPSVTYSP